MTEQQRAADRQPPSEQGPSRPGWQRGAAYLPIFLLLVFAALNAYRVSTERASPWVAGGYGMHSTLEGSILWRFVRIYGVSDSGERERLEFRRYLGMETAIFHRPTAANARALLKKKAIPYMKQNDLMAFKAFKNFEVELWEYTYAKNPSRLGAQLVSVHRVSRPL